MNKIKMLGLDLDGTLFNDERNISSRNLEAIEGAIAQGIIVLPATGRPPKGIPQEVLSIPGIRYAVTMNGAAVLDLNDNKVLYRDALETEAVIRILEMLMKYKGLLDVYYYDQCYTTSKGFKLLDTIDLPENFLKYVKKTRTPVDDLIGLVKEKNITADKINMIFPNMSVRNEVMKLLKADDSLAVTSSVAANVEINAKNANKGEGLRQLGQLLNIKPEEMMACGDADNDYLMIKNVGVGVAMGNAQNSIKEVADYVTLSNEEAGVAYAIEKFILRH